MPQSNKREYRPHVVHEILGSSQWDKDVSVTHTQLVDHFAGYPFLSVPHSPSVECTMPTLPKSLCRKVVAHTSNHVFFGKDAISQTPQSEETPRDQ